VIAGAPAFAQGVGDAAGYYGAPRIQATSPAREFIDHSTHARPGSAPASPAERIQIERQSVPSSAFSNSGS
uniref:hypothetical protein n=1 Tax=Acinetobacter baumannii TaxID=470 RepID=UPI001C095A28